MDKKKEIIKELDCFYVNTVDGFDRTRLPDDYREYLPKLEIVKQYCLENQDIKNDYLTKTFVPFICYPSFDAAACKQTHTTAGNRYSCKTKAASQWYRGNMLSLYCDIHDYFAYTKSEITAFEKGCIYTACVLLERMIEYYYEHQWRD